jgi:dolichol kinase
VKVKKNQILKETILSYLRMNSILNSLPVEVLSLGGCCIAAAVATKVAKSKSSLGSKVQLCGAMASIVAANVFCPTQYSYVNYVVGALMLPIAYRVAATHVEIKCENNDEARDVQALFTIGKGIVASTAVINTLKCFV